MDQNLKCQLRRASSIGHLCSEFNKRWHKDNQIGLNWIATKIIYLEKFNSDQNHSEELKKSIYTYFHL